MTNSSTAKTSAEHPARWKSILLWVLALLLMLAAAVYQRRTGPSYPQRGVLRLDNGTHRYALLRSQTNTEDARIVLPDLGSGYAARLFFKRYKVQEAYSEREFRLEETDGRNELVAYLPKQPPAGKLEYYILLHGAEGTRRAPERNQVIIRFKGPVSRAILMPHIFLMFLAMLVGMRAGLGALVHPARLKALAWFTLLTLGAGGLILGPLVQKAAFGQLWTGWPLGYDLTDNKTLIMWLVWAIGCGLMILLPSRPRVHRWAVGLAALLMTAVHLIPHSLLGSELDYGKVDKGTSPSQAVGTGD